MIDHWISVVLMETCYWGEGELQIFRVSHMVADRKRKKQSSQHLDKTGGKIY